jgi:DNA ligase-associated metallophosphoesterase
MSGDVRLAVAGEGLVLLPELAAFWVRARTLLVADPHWGKASAFRAAGFAVPRGTTLGGLDRLDAALDRTGARRLIFLGDYLHARTGRARATMDALAEWRARRSELDVVLVRGNHDRHAGDPPAALGVHPVDPPMPDGPFVFAHHPRESDVGYVIAGHLHPAARLSGAGGQRERLPCFWFGARVAVLPAFGEFTGVADIEPREGDRIFVIADQELVAMNG